MMLAHLAEIDPRDTAALERALRGELSALAPRGPRADRSIVARAEDEVRASPERCFSFDGEGRATLSVSGERFAAGRFETPALGELRRRAAEVRAHAGGSGGAIRFFVLDGRSPLTDIGALQAAAPPGSLFQVASQFNCLEAPDACIVDVADYFHDPTQGPRASISAFPGTLLRHYAAPGSREQSGARFVQREEGPQLNLLSAVCEAGTAEVRCGYLLTSNILRPDRFAALLTERADELRVGLHDGVEVVLGGDWDRAVLASPRPRIAQVFTSSVAAGGYSALDTRDPSFGAIVRGLQRAAHEGALLAAASIGASFAVMTLIGGGVFGNPVPLVYRSILAAIDAVRPLLHRDLTVVLNGFSIGQRVPHAELKKDAEARGGRLLVFTPDSVNAA